MTSTRSALVLSLSLLLLVGCATGSNGAGGASDSNGRSVLLEVSTEASQTVYPPGRTLDLRLYESGEAEFDFYTRRDPMQPGAPFKAELRRVRLDAEEIERLRQLLADPRLSAARAEYGPTKPILDSWVVTVVDFNRGGQQQRITLKENDSHLLLDRKGGVYPEPLIELLRLVGKINLELRNKPSAPPK